jgi:hypothetical protein
VRTQLPPALHCRRCPHKGIQPSYCHWDLRFASARCNLWSFHARVSAHLHTPMPCAAAKVESLRAVALSPNHRSPPPASSLLGVSPRLLRC